MTNSFSLGTFESLSHMSVGYRLIHLPVSRNLVLLQYLLYLGFGSGIATDILIAVSLCIVSPSRTRFKRYIRQPILVQQFRLHLILCPGLHR
jgi:hypothetical protein